MRGMREFNEILNVEYQKLLELKELRKEREKEVNLYKLILNDCNHNIVEFIIDLLVQIDMENVIYKGVSYYIQSIVIGLVETILKEDGIDIETKHNIRILHNSILHKIKVEYLINDFHIFYNNMLSNAGNVLEHIDYEAELIKLFIKNYTYKLKGE